ncbi:MAG: hypothetical protein J1F03_01385 [Oscillospiraceae bacterium]|nr:hypothetical protein [Oscillospiraceae bacterium]
MGFLDNIFGKSAGSNDTPKQEKSAIVLSGSTHIIGDEYIGLEYEVDCSFKAAKSHSEIELLCTYAPNDEYGHEGDIPYIAVQDDDTVFCAIDEYKESGSFEGAKELCPLSGKFLFKAKCGYYKYMMYFYAFERESDLFSQAGLCLVYPADYLGTQDEARLMRVLDDAAESFRIIK